MSKQINKAEDERGMCQAFSAYSFKDSRPLSWRMTTSNSVLLICQRGCFKVYLPIKNG